MLPGWSGIWAGAKPTWGADVVLWRWGLILSWDDIGRGSMALKSRGSELSISVTRSIHEYDISGLNESSTDGSDEIKKLMVVHVNVRWLGVLSR
jgi:hypothetical protein